MCGFVTSYAQYMKVKTAALIFNFFFYFVGQTVSYEEEDSDDGSSDDDWRGKEDTFL